MRATLIGIVPAAGYGTRLGPISGSKEMLDIGGAPVMERLVRRLEIGGCDEIRVVTRPDKDDVREYAEHRGLTVVLGHPAHIGESVEAGLEGCDPADLVALGFPDSLWEPADGYRALRDAIDRRSDVALGLFDFEEPARADVVVLGDDGRPRDILVKVAEPPSSLIWGCLVARSRALAGIGRTEWPSEHLLPLVGAGRVAARYLSDRYIDIGTPDALTRIRQDPRSYDDGDAA